MIAKLLQAKPIRARKQITNSKQGWGLRIRGKFKYFYSSRHSDSKFRKVHNKDSAKLRFYETFSK